MNSVDALTDIARTFMPMTDEAVITINCTHDGVKIQAIRENYEPWKNFYANQTGDDSQIINAFAYGELNASIPDLQGNFVLWNPEYIWKASDLVPLAHKEITFDSQYKVWFASFQDGLLEHHACLGSDHVELNLVVPRFKHFFPKSTWKVDDSGVEVFKKMLAQAAISGVDDFWLFSTKSETICASFDRESKSESTKRIVLAHGVPFDRIVPFAFPAKRFLKVLELTQNGSEVVVELSDYDCLTVKVKTVCGNYTFVLIGSDILIRKWQMEHLLPFSLPIDRYGHEEACMYGNWDPDLVPPR